MDHTPKVPGSKTAGSRKFESIDDLDPATKIKHLRKRYGAGLAPNFDGERTLGELLKVTGYKSLTDYVKHHGRRPHNE